MNEVKIHGESMDSERCYSTELNSDIVRQIQQKNILHEAEVLLVSKSPEALYQKNLCRKCFLESRNQNNMSTTAYKERIQNLEKQREELLEVNKQWGNLFRNMKQAYEKKPQDLLPLEVRNIKEENWLLRNQNHFLHKRKEYYKNERDHLSKALVRVIQKSEDGRTQTRLDISARGLGYEDLRAENAALLQQIKIYEEDFRQERADIEKLHQEKEKLQQTYQKLRLQIQANNKLTL